jgi:hypothetical protein
MKTIKLLIAASVFTAVSIYAQPNETTDSKFNQNHNRNVSPSEVSVE